MYNWKGEIFSASMPVFIFVFMLEFELMVGMVDIAVEEG
jgi:hypothetical protein